MLKRLGLKLILLVGLCVMAFGSQPSSADGCGQTCQPADDGWMLCVGGASYRQYCQINSHCYDCTPPPGENVCIPECTNLCGGGGLC
jgi:hypothetical protein